VAFVFNVYSRRIVSWRAATRMTIDLVLDCLEHAIWTRGRDGIEDLTGLVHRAPTPAAKYTSSAFTSRLIEAGVDDSVGSVGDAYDDVLAESQIGIYQTELIHPTNQSMTSHRSKAEEVSLRCTKPPAPGRVETPPEPPENPGRLRIEGAAWTCECPSSSTGVLAPSEMFR
jgi:transposase InsO family protein